MNANPNWSGAKTWIPKQYQRTAMQFLLANGGAGFFAAPGMGKTSSILGAFKILKSKGIAKRLLVVCPRRVMYEVWPAEIKKWADFQNMTYTILHGPGKEARLNDKVDIYLINYDGLPWISQNNRLARINADTLVCDELNRLKHTNTTRFKALRPHLDKFARRWGLTGTPVANGLLDLFGQVYILDQGYALGRFITKFRDDYFFPTGYGGYSWKPKQDAEERIYNQLSNCVLRLKAEDWLDLPKLMYNDIPVTLPAPAMRIYKSMEDALITTVNGTTVMSPNVASALNRCQQIANGCLYSEKGVEKIHDAKLDALESLVEELQGSPLLVSYGFQHDIAAITDRLGPLPVIGGMTSDKEAAEIVSKWNAGDIPVLLGHPASMGYGLNLQGACANLCFFSQTWNLEHAEQFIARVWRQGNEFSRVMAHRIIAEGTVDVDIIQALRNKDSVQTSLLTRLASTKHEY